MTSEAAVRITGGATREDVAAVVAALAVVTAAPPAAGERQPAASAWLRAARAEGVTGRLTASPADLDLMAIETGGRRSP